MLSKILKFVKYFENQSFDFKKSCKISANGVIYLHHERILQKV